MSPAPSRSLVLQRVKLSDALKICDGIIFKFYLELLHMYLLLHQHNFYTTVAIHPGLMRIGEFWRARERLEVSDTSSMQSIWVDGLIRLCWVETYMYLDREWGVVWSMVKLRVLDCRRYLIKKGLLTWKRTDLTCEGMTLSFNIKLVRQVHNAHTHVFKQWVLSQLLCKMERELYVN